MFSLTEWPRRDTIRSGVRFVVWYGGGLKSLQINVGIFSLVSYKSNDSEASHTYVVRPSPDAHSVNMTDHRISKRYLGVCHDSFAIEH